jgi:hypothetical protein
MANRLGCTLGPVRIGLEGHTFVHYRHLVYDRRARAEIRLRLQTCRRQMSGKPSWCRNRNSLTVQVSTIWGQARYPKRADLTNGPK